MEMCAREGQTVEESRGCKIWEQVGELIFEEFIPWDRPLKGYYDGWGVSVNYGRRVQF